MRYAALATDYDGTIAREGCVDQSTIEALRRLSASGRKLLLVTGRELADLRRVFEHFALFDRVGVENGAVMVLPTGVNKASGVLCALRELGLSAHNLVAIGDAENDHALLEVAECGAAVANAVPMLKAHADIVTRGDHGLGVEELAAHLMCDDLGAMASQRAEHRLLLGIRVAGGDPVVLPPCGSNVLIAGASGSGKSALATCLLEQLLARGYQCCMIDPAGAYDTLADVIHIGGARQPPEIGAVVDALENPDTSVVVKLHRIALQERAAFVASLQFTLRAMRGRTGRPHWLVLDQAHMLAPAEAQGGLPLVLDGSATLLLITLHTEQIARALRERIDVVVAIGADPAARLAPFTPVEHGIAVEHGEALAWLRGASTPPFRMRAAESSAVRQRATGR